MYRIKADNLLTVDQGEEEVNYMDLLTNTDLLALANIKRWTIFCCKKGKILICIKVYLAKNVLIKSFFPKKSLFAVLGFKY